MSHKIKSKDTVLEKICDIHSMVVIDNKIQVSHSCFHSQRSESSHMNPLLLSQPIQIKINFLTRVFEVIVSEFKKIWKQSSVTRFERLHCLGMSRPSYERDTVSVRRFIEKSQKQMKKINSAQNDCNASMVKHLSQSLNGRHRQQNSTSNISFHSQRSES